MLTPIKKFAFATLLLFTPIYSAVAMTGISGNFSVGIGPLELGGVKMTSNCVDDTCYYETQVEGSFLFVNAKINEKGNYKTNDTQVLPVATNYSEKIGSKKKTYAYDFIAKTIKNQKTNKKTKLPDNVLPFIPLLNQVALDLRYGGPKKEYKFLSNQKTKKAIITAYTTTTTDNGVLHHFTGTEKDKKIDFYYLQNGELYELEKIGYGSFHMARKR